MNSTYFTEKAKLDLLKDNYLKALASNKHCHSSEALDRLDVAKDAYVYSKLDSVTTLTRIRRNLLTQ